MATVRPVSSVSTASYTRTVLPSLLGVAVQVMRAPDAGARYCMEQSRVTHMCPVVKAAVPHTVSARVTSAPPWTMPMGLRLEGCTSSTPTAL